MSSPAYLGTQLSSRDASSAGRRVLERLSQDAQHLIEQFYPRPERLAPGWMVVTGTKAEGGKPSHKDEIIGFYEQGMDEADIAHATHHHIKSVGHYIRDYQRVKLILQKKGDDDHASLMRLLDMSPAVSRRIWRFYVDSILICSIPPLSSL